MTMIGTAVLACVVLCGVAFGANRRFRNERRLPMQWWPTGDVTWSAPRSLALAFVPVLATCVLAFDVVLALTLKPRVGQEYLVLPTLVGLGMMFFAIQLLHLWLIAKTLRRGGS